MNTELRLKYKAADELRDHVTANPDIKLSDLESKMFEIALKAGCICDQLAELIAEEEDLTSLTTDQIRLKLYDDVLRYLRLCVRVSTEFKEFWNREGGL